MHPCLPYKNISHPQKFNFQGYRKQVCFTTKDYWFKNVQLSDQSQNRNNCRESNILLPSLLLVPIPSAGLSAQYPSLPLEYITSSFARNLQWCAHAHNRCLIQMGSYSWLSSLMSTKQNGRVNEKKYLSQQMHKKYGAPAMCTSQMWFKQEITINGAPLLPLFCLWWQQMASLIIISGRGVAYALIQHTILIRFLYGCYFRGKKYRGPCIQHHPACFEV